MPSPIKLLLCYSHKLNVIPLLFTLSDTSYDSVCQIGTTGNSSYISATTFFYIFKQINLQPGQVKSKIRWEKVKVMCVQHLPSGFSSVLFDNAANCYN